LIRSSSIRLSTLPGGVPININVRFGSGLVPANGLSRLPVTLAAGSTVGTLLDTLKEQFPESPFNVAVVVIGGEHVALSTVLSNADEVALLLPIAGG